MATITKNIINNTSFTSNKPQLLFAENSTFYDGKCSKHGHRVFVSNILIKRKERWEPLFNIHKEWFGPTAWRVYLISKNTTYLGEDISDGGVPTLLKAADLAWRKYQDIHLEDGEYKVADKSFTVMQDSNKFSGNRYLAEKAKDDFCVETSFAKIPDESKIPHGLMDNQGTYLYDSVAKLPIYGNEKVSDNKILFRYVMSHIQEEDYERAFSWASYNMCGTSIEKRKLFHLGEWLLFEKGLKKPNYSEFGCSTAEEADKIITKAINALNKLYLDDNNAAFSAHDNHPTYAVYDVRCD